jgi:hypothetical protein
VLVIGLMRGDPSLADGPTVLSAIADPRSANEQYQGLILARLCWRLSGSDRAAIRFVIQEDPDIRTGTARRQAAEEIMRLPDLPDDSVIGR